MDLLRDINVEQHTCRVCGRPSGLFDECDRCFLDRLESQFDELMDESALGQQALPEFEDVEWTDDLPEPPPSKPPPAVVAQPEPAPGPEPEAEPEPEPEPDPEPADPVAGNGAHPPPAVAPEPRPRAERRDRRPLLLLLGLGAAAVLAIFIFALGNGDDAGDSAPASSQPAAASAEPPAPVIGDWSGRVEIRYESGVKDHMTQTLSITSVEQGEDAGTARSRQNSGSCSGTLTATGPEGAGYGFDYTERNTDECIKKGHITLTPRDDGRLDYREETRFSVNRGTVSSD